jgi:hypothetical protein
MVARVIKKQIEYIEYREKQIFWTAFSIIILLFVSYGFLVNRTILNAISKESMNKEISTINSQVNSLEFQYLNIKNSINMNLALSKGFVAVSNENFAELSSSKSLSLSINKR